MGNSEVWDHGRFRDFVLSSAQAVGLNSPADIARATGLKPAVFSKWFRGLERPSDDSLRKVAAATRTKYADLLVLAGRASVDEVNGDTNPEPPPALNHPIARELDQMLDPSSPLDEPTRTDIVRLVEFVIRDHRRVMRRHRTA